MEKLTLEKAKEINGTMVTEEHLILKGCEMLGMDIKDVSAIVIEGMKAHAGELQLAGTAGN